MSSRNNLPILAFAAAGLLGVAVLLALIVAPEDANQGVSQRIFYFHVPIALTAYLCFGLGAWKALRLLWVGGERRDLESYTWIHQGTIFGALTLITGSIWARASWGVWWSLELEPARPVPRPLPLRPRLLHAPLLDRARAPRRERICAVYALFGVALIPVSFFAMRLASDFIHPTVFTREGPQMTDDVHRLRGLLGCDLASRVRHVPGRARRQAHRREPPRAARGPVVIEVRT